MKVIEKLENFIDSEIHDAEVYAKCALKYKESDPTLAKLFYDLSTEEWICCTEKLFARSSSIARRRANRLRPCRLSMIICTRSKSTRPRM